MKTKKFFKLLVLEIVALAFVVAYFLIDSSDIYRWYVGNTNFVKQDTSCNLHNSKCSVILKDGSIMTLSIEPKTIPLMKPIKLILFTQGVDLENLELKIFATNMNMGLIETQMKRVSKNRYTTEVTLPSCIVGNMIWNANIIANKPTKSVGAVFEFQTGK